MNILFSCHCKYSQHSELLVSSSKYGKFGKLYNPSVQSQYGIENIYFIDTDVTQCSPSDTQYTNWSAIPSNSMDIIFLVHCPIYGIFFSDKYKNGDDDATNPFDEISKHSMRILKENGRLIIPSYSLPGKNHDIYIPMNLQVALLQRKFKKYKVHHSTQLPLYFKSVDDGILKGTYLIIEKTVKTISKKSKKTRRN